VLSNYIHGDIDCLKLDIEGAEDKVLRELEQSKKIAHIRYMIVEYHHHILKDTDVLSGSLSLLERNGFGYQLEGRSSRPFESMQFQDILIFAYRKHRLGQVS
jgi:hypothetical protein